MKTSSILILITLATISQASGQSMERFTTATAANEAPSSATVSGQIFVVPRGQQAIKLPSVEVAIIHETQFKQWISALQTLKRERRQSLAKKLQALAGSEKLASAALVEARALEVAMLAAARAGNATLHDWYDKADITARRERELKAVTLETERTMEEFSFYNSDDFYLDPRYPVAAVAKTDTEGKFSITAPSGRYVLAAQAIRKTYSRTERYCWRVWIDITNTTKFVILSNNNLFGTRCRDCVRFERR